MSRFYITTPLYYVNDQPHIGHAYTTVTADVLARYYRLFGEETLFLTGTDEHGLKCQQAAEKRSLSPKAHADDMVKNYRQIWEELNIKYDIFFRTTDEFHQKAVQKSLTDLHESGDIYSAEYEGWYSVSEEIFYTEKELVDGKSPTGREVQRVKEKNYFFRMSKYQKALVDHIEAHPEFIQPIARRNEVLGFLRQPLNDLCISRPKARVSWGIELPFDKDYVTYVWFDALLNYATGVGFQQPDKESIYAKWWVETGARHLLGKDILTTHAVYWPTMLLALKARVPKQIFAHGWLLNKDQAKMSKSFGDVVKPLDIKNIVGTDALRYFLIRDIHLGNDAPISLELVAGRVNTDLANNLGNLLSRSINLIGKYFAGRLPEPGALDDSAEHLKRSALKLSKEVEKAIRDLKPSAAVEAVMSLLTDVNRYLEEKAPWKLAKTDLAGTATCLMTALECVRIAALLLWPVMPGKISTTLQALGLETSDLTWQDTEKWPGLKPGTELKMLTPLFPRIDLDKPSITTS